MRTHNDYAKFIRDNRTAGSKGLRAAYFGTPDANAASLLYDMFTDALYPRSQPIKSLTDSLCFLARGCRVDI